MANELNATDIHLRLGSPPKLRSLGAIVAPLGQSLTENDMNQLLFNILGPDHASILRQRPEFDTVFEHPQYGRLRVHISPDRAFFNIAIRILSIKVPEFKDLNLPENLAELCKGERGLVLFVGTTGSGKTTTQAAMIAHILQTQRVHVITIEDPIEFTYKNHEGHITQKEVGRDVRDFKTSLPSILRQDPDVIVIGEIRDRETMDAAINASETGHLVLSTLHALDTPESIHRILSFYSASEQMQVRRQLSSILKAVVGTRLVPKSDETGLIPAVEILVNNHRIGEMIRTADRFHEIHDVIEESHETYGMQSFDQSLMFRYSHGEIKYSDALRFTSRPGMFDLRAGGVFAMGSEKKWKSFEDPEQHRPFVNVQERMRNDHPIFYERRRRRLRRKADWWQRLWLWISG